MTNLLRYHPFRQSGLHLGCGNLGLYFSRFGGFDLCAILPWAVYEAKIQARSIILRSRRNCNDTNGSCLVVVVGCG